MSAENPESKIYYYIEHDGKVYLIEKNGILQFPKAGDSLPFEVIEKRTMIFDNNKVIYCGADLEKHPEEWLNKDNLPKLENIHPVVRQSLHMSFPRCVAEAVIVNENKVLLVNASRGVTKGFWNLPGGFMEYGESPDYCILREIKEEIGVNGKILKLIGVYDKASAYHPYHLIAFVYLCEVENFNFKLDPDEIEDVSWFEIDEALQITKSHFTKLALNDIKKKN